VLQLLVRDGIALCARFCCMLIAAQQAPSGSVFGQFARLLCVQPHVCLLCAVAPCSKDTLLLDLHPNAKMILGTRNIAFMHGPEHKKLRKSFLALFTRRALSTYIVQQDGIIRE
jgi:cytochrome P450